MRDGEQVRRRDPFNKDSKVSIDVALPTVVERMLVNATGDEVPHVDKKSKLAPTKVWQSSQL